jgi:hypothetical protein
MFVFLILLALLVLSSQSPAQVPATMFDQMRTSDHLKRSGWWPRKPVADAADYVGAGVCAQCHESIAKGQSRHSMAHTAMVATDSPLLATGTAEYEDGHYSYSIQQQEGHAYYSVTNHSDTISVPLLWAFGSGNLGQSYLFEKDGSLFEARMSFLPGVGFDLTPGHPKAIPSSLEFALGRPIPAGEQVKCFSCHTVGSSAGRHFDPGEAMLGISCEGCHGPGAAHVAMAKSGVGGLPGLIFNPAHLTPPQSLDFCGACHRAWWDVADVTDIHSVRFPALRLEQSKCWGNGDARLICANCHDPHRALVREPSAYDRKCLNCHNSNKAEKSTASHEAAACPVSTKNCTSCHMPKYEIPGMKISFTDHKIRVVKGKSFQD